eukprot:gene16842-23069_t
MSHFMDLTIQTRNMKEEEAKLLAEDQFENPEMQDDPVERLKDAVILVKLRNWSRRKACLKAGINNRTLTKALESESYTYHGPGRQPYLSAAGQHSIINQITEETLNLNASYKRKVESMMNDKHSEEFGYSEQVDASENVSRSTQWKYRQAMGLVEGIKDDVKAKARQKAFLNLRNPLSLCASLTVVSEEVDSELFFSSDDVSILVNGWDKPTVITTKEAQKLLNDEQNILISTTEDSAKRRVIVFNFTISKHGNNLICSVVIIKLYMTVTS